jgi:hypothetical protein
MLILLLCACISIPVSLCNPPPHIRGRHHPWGETYSTAGQGYDTDKSYSTAGQGYDTDKTCRQSAPPSVIAPLRADGENTNSSVSIFRTGVLVIIKLMMMIMMMMTSIKLCALCEISGTSCFQAYAAK